VSPLLTDLARFLPRRHIAVALMPGHLHWAVRPGGLRGVRKNSVSSAGSESLPEGASGWRPAVAALASLLAAHARKGDRLTVILSSRFVPALALAWPDDIEDDEANAYAEHQFRRVFGPHATDWKVRVDAAPGTGGRLACAVDRELLDALDKAATAAGVMLVSTQPLIAAAVNQCRPFLGKGRLKLVVAEAGHYAGASLQNGNWQSIRQGRLRSNGAPSSDNDLASAVAREAALAAGETLFLYSPDHAETATTGLGVRHIRLPSVPAHAFARAGLSRFTRTVRLDFTRLVRTPAWPGWLLLVLSITSSAYTAVEFRRLQAETEIAQGRLERLRARSPQAPRDAKLAQVQTEELRRAGRVTRHIALPWESLFRSVEEAATRKVALLALQPDASQNLVRITAESREFADALEFVRRLEETRRLRGVHLASHLVVEQDPQKPVRFVVIGHIATEKPT